MDRKEEKNRFIYIGFWGEECIWFGGSRGRKVGFEVWLWFKDVILGDVRFRLV